MKQKQSKGKVLQMRSEYPHKNTPVQLAFEAEIKRIAKDRGEPMGATTALLSKFTGVSERQIYNYRMGKTPVAPEQIKIFCEQFNSAALAQAWISTFNVVQTDRELFDLTRFANKSLRNVLEAGDKFLGAFEDGKIDGHELNELHLAGAAIKRDADQMIEVAVDAYKRNRERAA